MAGVVTLGVWSDGKKTGLQALDLRCGERRGLARLAVLGSHAATIGRWAFDPVALQWGADALRAACPTDLLIVDELGPLELSNAGGWVSALTALQSGAYGAAVVTVRPGLVQRFSDVAAVRHTVVLGQPAP